MEIRQRAILAGGKTYQSPQMDHFTRLIYHDAAHSFGPLLVQCARYCRYIRTCAHSKVFFLVGCAKPAAAALLSGTLACARAGEQTTSDPERIASSEVLPDGDLLPHLICSPPAFDGGGGYEAGQHGNT